jgi:hypothetical protein
MKYALQYLGSRTHRIDPYFSGEDSPASNKAGAFLP